MADGDEWVITGQKVWTTQAQFADYIFLLGPHRPRSAQARRHLLPPHAHEAAGGRGPAHQQIDGSAEFNEVYFDGARCPRRERGRRRNNGWKVAMTTLGFERGSSATTGHRRFTEELDAIIDDARRTGPHHRSRRSARAWPTPGPR